MWKKIVDFFSLFGSTATLLCCAIPALLSVLAGGAAVSAFASTFPFLITISQYKNALFIIAGALLVFNGILTLKPQGTLACSITGGRGCETAGKFTKVIFWISVVIYGVGAFAAYGLAPLLIYFDSLSEAG